MNTNLKRRIQILELRLRNQTKKFSREKLELENRHKKTLAKFRVHTMKNLKAKEIHNVQENKKLLSKCFTNDQIKMLAGNKRKLRWSETDISRAAVYCTIFQSFWRVLPIFRLYGCVYNNFRG